MRANMTPLRLFMTADAVGGVFQYAMDCACGLHKFNIQTTLAMLGPRMSEDQRAAALNIEGLRLIETGLPLDWLAEDPQSVETAACLIAALAEQSKAEVVHLNMPALAIASYAAPVVAVAHSCLASWWIAVKEKDLPDAFIWRAELMAKGLRAAAAVVCPSRAFSKTVKEIYGRLPVTVHNGRGKRVAPAIDLSGPVSAFTAGRLWDEGKNIATLDAAASLLNLPFEAAGPVEGPNGVRARLRNLSAIGALCEAEIAARLARQPIFVSAALYEPFGLAALEAAQAGCALVLSDIPTFRELWEGAAIFAPARDPGAFAVAVKTLAADQTLRARFGAAARVRAEIYSMEAMAGQMAMIYRQLRAQAARAAQETAA